MSGFEVALAQGESTSPGRDNGIVSISAAQCCLLGMADRVKGDTYRTSHRIAPRLVYVDQACLAKSRLSKVAAMPSRLT